MSPIRQQVVDLAWARIQPHVEDLARLIPVDVEDSIGPELDIQEFLSTLIERLSGHLPDIEVPGLTPWVSAVSPAPDRGMFGFFGGSAASARANPPSPGVPPGGSSANLPADLLARWAGHCQHAAGELAVRLAAHQEFSVEAPDATREGAERPIARRLALGVLTAKAAMRDLSRRTRLQDPDGLSLGLMIGLSLVSRMRAESAAGTSQPPPIDHHPQGHLGLASVEDHQWSLVEPSHQPTTLPDEAFRENGMVAAVREGVVVRTGVGRGRVFVTFTMADDPPADPTGSWSEIVDVSFEAETGGAAIAGMPRVATALAPGTYRARVMARRRDDAEEERDQGEAYEVIVWPAPAQVTRIWASNDRVGHRLRGEVEPPPVVRPEVAYRWVRRSILSDGATVTMVSGLAPDDVLRAFGADPSRPRTDELLGYMYHVAVGTLGDVVVAVELAGWEGNRPEVLRRLSACGRAASMYWSVNSATGFSAAEDGEVLDSFHSWSEAKSPRVLQLAEDLDLDTYVDNIERGLVVAGRFTGEDITQDFVTDLLRSGLSYEVLPWLPDHRRFKEWADYSYGPLLNEKPALLAATERDLRDITWWAVGELADHDALDDPEVAATLASRSLSPEAVLHARLAQARTSPSTSRVSALWRALHSATNPDPVAALIAVADALRMPLPWEVATLASLRRRLTDLA